jgi:hypothetical protein
MEATLTWEGGSPADLRESIEALPAALEDAFDSAGDDIVSRMRGTADEEAPADEGRLSSSIEGFTETVGGTLFRIVIGTNVEYARPLEEGTDPFFPPPSELRGWASRVLGDADLAYPVARSIAETGIEEHRFLRSGLYDNIEWALDRLLEAIEDAAAEVGLG